MSFFFDVHRSFKLHTCKSFNLAIMILSLVWLLTIYELHIFSESMYVEASMSNWLVYKKPFHLVRRFSYMDVMTKILGWKFIMIFNWERKTWFGPIRSLFTYLTFIGQKISYFRHYVHVWKSPDDMNKSNVTKCKDFML